MPRKRRSSDDEELSKREEAQDKSSAEREAEGGMRPTEPGHVSDDRLTDLSLEAERAEGHLQRPFARKLHEPTEDEAEIAEAPEEQAMHDAQQRRTRPAREGEKLA